MSVLVIAEKPSVANTVATVLGANKKGVNYLYNDRYIVSWCLGHLVKLDDPVAYGDRFAEKPWKFENLPIIPEKCPRQEPFSDTGCKAPYQRQNRYNQRL